MNHIEQQIAIFKINKKAYTYDFLNDNYNNEKQFDNNQHN